MREDPFADVWQSEVVPQLVADTEGRLQVLTLLTARCAGGIRATFSRGSYGRCSGGSATGGCSFGSAPTATGWSASCRAGFGTAGGAGALSR